MSESKPVFDADAYKRTQHYQWNEDAAAWHRWGPTLQTWFGGVTQTMLDLAQVGPGQRFLDIAAGAGVRQSGRISGSTNKGGIS